MAVPRNCKAENFYCGNEMVTKGHPEQGLRNWVADKAGIGGGSINDYLFECGINDYVGITFKTYCDNGCQAGSDGHSSYCSVAKGTSSFQVQY
ncbi:MAG: hypothetical protein HETSPECPRED_006585 [Heterodermia speciosa]|uniref:Uncharacterized protein n=1 Tax=Heterodermia speciosa TaxID=116794 RepID=A0A8H3FTB2_9LECA|nr:MAG: hypothetical protein HETSPECPRED_006585 [Heterodermia speciosa]